MKSDFIIGAVSLNQTPLDWEQNTKNIIEAIHLAKSQHVQLLCFPELCITGYGCEDLFLGDWIYETALEEVQKILPHTATIATIIGLPILFEDKRYNCACVIQNQEILGFYAKNHLANDGVHYETRWFSSWNFQAPKTIQLWNQSFPMGKPVYSIDNHIIGIEICEDAWRKDRPADNYGQVDIIFNPSASHFPFAKTKIRQDIVQKSSINYNCTYIYANLLGNEAGRMIYDGEILIAKKGDFYAQNTRFSYQNINLITHNMPNQ